MIAGEIAKEGLVTATVKSTAEWIEHKLGINAEKFTEHVAVEVVAKLVVTAVIGLAFFFASRGIWRAIYRKFRAATIRRTASASFVIVHCPIANDIDNAIGNEIGIRLETAFRAFAGKANVRPFHVMTFPLALSGDDGTKAYDAAIETAKRWLQRTNGNLLIWGKRIKGDSVGMIRLIGRDQKTGTIEVRRVDFDKRAADFDQALANAIAYEAAQLTQVTLLEPEQVHLEVLREVSDKLKRLAASDAPALSNKWRERMAMEHWRLTEEIVRRTPNLEERKDLEAQARLEIATLNPAKQPRRFAETALRIGTLARKRNWIDPDPGELDEARTFLATASEIFKTIPDIERAAEAALERVKIRRQQRIFLQPKDVEVDSIYDADFEEAGRLVKLAGNKALDGRLAAENCHRSPDKAVAEICGFDRKGPSGAFEFIDHVTQHLDNSELIDLTTDLTSAVFYRGDREASAQFWRATPQIAEAVLRSRPHWTPEERCYLNALIAGDATTVAPRLRRVLGDDAATPFVELGNQLSAKVLDSFELIRDKARRYIDIRTLAALASGTEFDGTQREARRLDALRICAGAEAARFPLLHFGAKRAIIVLLNNKAKALDSLEAAEEAFRRSSDLEHEINFDGNLHSHYISAYAGWQAARLTPQSDDSSRASQSSKAHSLAEMALRLADEQGNQAYATAVHDLLRSIETDFPNLASNSEAADAATNQGSKHAPDSL